MVPKITVGKEKGEKTSMVRAGKSKSLKKQRVYILLLPKSLTKFVPKMDTPATNMAKGVLMFPNNLSGV